MAWTFVGVTGSTANKTANSTSQTITLNKIVGSGAAVNDLLIYTIGVLAATSISGVDEGAVLSVTDSSSNRWIKLRENLIGEASSAGTVNSMWYAKVDTALSTAGVVTAIFGSSAARDRQVGIIARFSNSGGSARVVDSTFTQSATTVCGSLDIATNGTEVLRVRTIASHSTAASMVNTAGWTSFATVRTGSAAPDTAGGGEFLIGSATTAASAPTINGISASIYAVFEENFLMGDGEL